jgi:hypothetical protein
LRSEELTSIKIPQPKLKIPLRYSERRGVGASVFERKKLC